MAISRTTRTHLIYQFIILTLMFLGIGYNELLPDRKFVLFLAFVPMFLYQLFILSCCIELMPVPSWMNFFEATNRKVEKIEKTETESHPSSPASSFKQASEVQTERPSGQLFADLSERIQAPRMFERKTVTLGTSKKLGYPQKSKSWMNLSDSNKSLAGTSLSREGSLDVLAKRSNIKLRSSHALSKADRANFREERASKAKSWKPSMTAFVSTVDNEIGTSADKTKATQLSEGATETTFIRPPLLRASAVQQEESELSKSYSFPFRQRRLETWLEMKETETRESNQSLDMPYWQTVGYNLAVKYEARRRRRAVSSPTKLNSAGEIPLQTFNLQKSVEFPKDTAQNGKQSLKKTAKSASYCINKIKTSFSNLVSKKKDDLVENVSANPSKVLKPSLSFKSKNKNVLYNTKTEDKVSLPELPQFLSTERPLIFYPKYIPFEKERFENDVKKKMVEFAEEQKANVTPFQRK